MQIDLLASENQCMPKSTSQGTCIYYDLGTFLKPYLTFVQLD